MRQWLAIPLSIAVFVAVSGVASAQPSSWEGPSRPGRNQKRYEITIDSAPQNASVYLEEERFGTVGLTPVILKLPAGTWKIIIKKDGHEAAARIVTVKKSSKLQKTFVSLIEADAPVPPPKPIPAPTPAPTPAPPPEPANRLVVLSDAPGAIVSIDGRVVGKTPFDSTTITPGNHTVSVRVAGFAPKEEQVSVLPGVPLTVELNFSEVKPPESEPPMLPSEEAPPSQTAELKQLDSTETKAAPEPQTEEEKKLERRALSSLGARPLPRGRSIIDMGFGYPYYMNVAAAVGVGSIKDRFAVDAGVTIRSYFSRTEIGLRSRLSLLQAAPFTFGVFAELGGGANFVDSSGRNTFFTNLGAAISLTGLGMFTVSGRVYANLYSDRHCPTADVTAMQFTERGVKPLSTCSAYLMGTLADVDRQHIDNDLLDGPNDIFSRDTGARLMTSVFAELAISEQQNLWIMVEGAPFQSERAAYTHLFSRVMFSDDPVTYVTLGSTYKF